MLLPEQDVELLIRAAAFSLASGGNHGIFRPQSRNHALCGSQKRYTWRLTRQWRLLCQPAPLCWSGVFSAWFQRLDSGSIYCG